MTEDPETPSRGLGLFPLLRFWERRAGDKPRIGRNRTLRQASVTLRQDPYLAFPDSDIGTYQTDGERPVIGTRFLGFFGPQGALPLHITEEVVRWGHHGDTAFLRFTDILATRFLQLFFRAWSDARAVTQFDHPTDDRFRTYVAALSGVGTPSYRQRDHIDDIVRTPMVGLHAARIKSPVRLRQMIALHLGADIEVEEHVPAWIAFEQGSQNRLGQRGSSLGRDMYLGAQVQTVGEKIRLHVHAASMAEYRSFLPGGAAHEQLCDVVFWYLGKTFDVEVVLFLAADQVEPTALGQTGDLGWMACIAPASRQADDELEITRFALVAKPAMAA